MKIPSKAQLEPIARRYGLRLIVLFGSQASGRTHPESDVDVAVLARRPPTTSKRLSLWRDLSGAFQTDIDLTLLDHASPVLLNRIARHGQILYESGRWEWENYRGYCLRRFWDSAKFIEATERYVARRAQEMRRAR